MEISMKEEIADKDLLEKIDKCKELLNDPFVRSVLESIPVRITNLETGRGIEP